MEVMVTPNRRATTQCPSSCRRTHPNRRRMKRRLITPDRAPDWLETLKKKNDRRNRKVKWIRMGIPSAVPSRKDQFMEMPSVKAGEDESSPLAIRPVIGKLPGQLFLFDPRPQQLKQVHGGTERQSRVGSHKQAKPEHRAGLPQIKGVPDET